MTDEQIIIDDQKKTIHRLQQECTEKTNAIIALGEQLKRKEQELNDYKKQFKADTKEMEDYQNEIARHLQSIEYWYNQTEAKEQECETLASQLDFEVQKKERLEQECEELKRQHQSDKGLITETGKINYQLLQEYDKLKAENEELKKKCNIYTCGICGNKEDCNKLYKTLTEIKEIAESQIKAEENNRYKTNGYIVALGILQKISEVEE